MALKQKVRDFTFRVKDVLKTGEFEGYASVYEVIDAYQEVVAPGAFAASLRRWAETDTLPPALWQHDSRQPVGPFTKMVEDQKGLYVQGRLLVDDVAKAREARALMQAKAISGMSIGFSPVVEEWNSDTKLLTLKEIDLWEVSIVTFPANTAARVEAVKSVMAGLNSGTLPALKEFEGFLREAGFSKTQATAIASRGLGPLLREADSGTVDPIDVRSMVDEAFGGAKSQNLPFTLKEIGL